MSNRTMLEINHDRYPHGPEEEQRWLRDMLAYLRSGDPTTLPRGVTWFGMRHHSEPCPLPKPPRGWDNNEPPAPLPAPA